MSLISNDKFTWKFLRHPQKQLLEFLREILKCQVSRLITKVDYYIVKAKYWEIKIKHW